MILHAEDTLHLGIKNKQVYFVLLSVYYSYLYGYAKKILTLAVNKSIPITQASLRIGIVYSLAYSYLCPKEKKMI